MGIMNFIKGELLDIIEWPDEIPGVLVHRFDRKDHAIKKGAKLIVRPGQMAVFVNEGQIADKFEPGTYSLETKNIPILRTLLSLPYGFETPFKAEVYFMDDIVARVDSLYRTIPEKSSRAIAGMSTGGLQALYMAANYPDSFDYIGLFSPYTRDSIFGLRHPEFYGGLYRKLKVQFREPPRYFGLMIGRKDIFYPEMKSFDRSLSKRGYGHELIVTSGGHKWTNWRKYLIDFYQKTFKD